jgi:hypothetical protein
MRRNDRKGKKVERKSMGMKMVRANIKMDNRIGRRRGKEELKEYMETYKV